MENLVLVLGNNLMTIEAQVTRVDSGWDRFAQ